MEDFFPKNTSPTTNPESSTPSTSGQSPGKNGPKRKARRVSAVLRRVSSEWNGFLTRVKQATRVNYSDEEALDSLFLSSDDESMERIPRPRKSKVSPAEAQFLEAYKKCSSLEEYHTSQQESLSASNSMPSTLRSSDTKFYEALDCSYLRGKLSSGSDLKMIDKKAIQLTLEESNTKSRLFEKDENLGNALWEIRRARWLSPDECDDVEEKVTQRAAASPIKSISRDLYPRIYREFVEKAKPLRREKQINLEDMMVVINTGWIHEKVWEAASNGL